MIGGVQLTHQEMTILVIVCVVAYCYIFRLAWGKD